MYLYKEDELQNNQINLAPVLKLEKVQGVRKER
jgi:hypothetical protein